VARVILETKLKNLKEQKAKVKQFLGGREPGL